VKPSHIDGSLAPLRYVPFKPVCWDGIYAMRARVAFVGDSCDLGPADSSYHGRETERDWNEEIDSPNSLRTSYTRCEPVSAPVILGSEKPCGSGLKRGIHRLIVDAKNDTDTRWSAPPRCSHKMAEVHGMFDQSTPESLGGFSDVALEDDGTFPSRPETGESELVTASVPIRKPPHPLKRPTAPYWPDPMARAVYCKFTPFGPSTHVAAMEETINFYPLSGWPRAKAFRISLKALPASRCTATLKFHRGSRNLVVGLPPGWRGRLELRSALGQDSESREAHIRPLEHWASVLEHAKVRSRVKRSGAHRIAAAETAELETIRRAFRESMPSELTFAATHGFLAGTPLTEDAKLDLREVLHACAAGHIPTVTPAVVLECIHAVPRPLDAPTVVTVVSAKEHRSAINVSAIPQPCRKPQYANEEIDRGSDQTAAWLDITVRFDAKSTGQVALVGAWSDPQDGPGLSETAVTRRQTTIGEIKAEDAVDDRRVSRQQQFTHEFGDTKHRLVTYSGKATSRFAEQFDVKKQAEMQLQSKKSVAVRILNTANPPPPQMSYVVPTYRWNTHLRNRVCKPDHEYGSYRIGGGIRVYLERDWFASGADEMLGILVMPQPETHGPCRMLVKDLLSFEQINEVGKQKLLRSVTRWGMDPIYRSEWNKLCDRRSPGAAQFEYQDDCAIVSLADLPPEVRADSGKASEEEGRLPLCVLGYKVRYDPQKDLRYADLRIKDIPSYNAFVQLSLVRFQPNSREGKWLSPRIRADFVQLQSNRSVTVMLDPEDRDRKTLLVTVAGSPVLASSTSASDITSRLSVRVAKPTEDGGSVWTWDDEIEIVAADNRLRVSLPLPEHAADGILFQARLKWPGSVGARRLYVGEYEQFRGSGPTERLVYMDVLGV
jgi:hypothetical protein